METMPKDPVVRAWQIMFLRQGQGDKVRGSRMLIGRCGVLGEHWSLVAEPSFATSDKLCYDVSREWISS